MWKNEQRSIDKIRVSSGSAVVLGLIEGFLKAKPTTAYLLTFIERKCTANCGFCSQAKSSKSREDLLSRVAWPVFQTQEVVSKLASAARRGEIKRVCIQALNYPAVHKDLLALVKEIRMRGTDVPISISCQPLNMEEMKELVTAGVERIGIPLDAATKEVFERVKGSIANGPYDWDRQLERLLGAIEVFGKGKVSTHLIVGLGETEKEMLATVQWCVDNNVYPALFSFTPIPGTVLEHSHSPTMRCYRRIQLGRYLIVLKKTRVERMSFDEKGRLIDFGVLRELQVDAVRSGAPFLTSGCPHCNRPFYNEKPSGPFYNFPTQPTPRDIEEIEKQLK